MKTSYIAAICGMVLGAIAALSSSAFAQQKSAAACAAEWRANKAANQAAGKTEKLTWPNVEAGPRRRQRRRPPRLPRRRLRRRAQPRPNRHRPARPRHQPARLSSQPRLRQKPAARAIPSCGRILNPRFITSAAIGVTAARKLGPTCARRIPRLLVFEQRKTKNILKGHSRRLAELNRALGIESARAARRLGWISKSLVQCQGNRPRAGPCIDCG